MKPNTLEFQNNLPMIKEENTLDQFWCSGGRVGLTILRHGGIGEILYYGNQNLNSAGMFRAKSQVSAWEKVFRLCVTIDGVRYYPEFNNTFFYPFGYVSQTEAAGVSFRHELLLTNDEVIQRIQVLANPQKKKLSLRLILHGHSKVSSSGRRWIPWKVDEESGLLSTVAIDSLTEEECSEQIKKNSVGIRPYFPNHDSKLGETYIGLVSNLAVVMSSAHGNTKYYFDSELFEKDAFIAIAFQSSAKKLKQRAADLAKDYKEECARVLSQWDERTKSSPQISIPSSEVVQSCLTNIPAVIDSMEVKDIAGGFRAGMQAYWIWYDLMLDCSGMLFANDAASVRDMLSFFKGVNDPVRGLPALVTTQLVPFLGIPFNTQCTFVTMLYGYYCHTGDLDFVRECHPLAVWLIDRCLDQEVGQTGLVEGASMPDFPAGQDGHDISAAGNSYFYQSLRALNFLSAELERVSPGHGFGALADKYAEVAGRTKESFNRYLFDEAKGYYLDSVSSRDFSKREHYPCFAVQWQTHFAGDLVGENVRRAADFLAENFTRPQGIGGMYPDWDSAHPGDGNQFLAYYPSWSETFYRNAMKAAGRTRELVKWFDDVAWFWERFTIPEGLTYDAENEGFTPDNPGGKQAFGALAWYSVFFRAILGFEVDERGVVVEPSPVNREITVKNIVVRGKKIDLTVSGKGKKTEVSFNGVELGSKAIIPFDKLQERNHISIRHITISC